MKLKHRVASLVLIACLSACGGSDDPAAPPAVAQSISGTVAAGAPVVGNVFVKDSLGSTRGPVVIEANGNYTIDVTGLTAPFLFRAEGTVAGRTVVLSSAATASDTGGTINITPFTDLIVANVAGVVADRYFESFGGAGTAPLSADQLNAARQALTNRLLPILQEMGVSESFDLLRTAFSANRQGFDAVMDAVRVSVDPVSNQATITDLINNEQIVDDLTRTDDVEVIATPPAGSIRDAVSDLDGVALTLQALTTLFKNVVPGPDNATLLTLVDDDLLENGAGIDEFLSDEYLLDASLTGAKFSSPVIVSRPENLPNALNVRFALADTTGRTESIEMQFRKDATTGKWKLAGNQRLAGSELDAINHRYVPPTGQANYQRFIELWIESSNPAVQSAEMTGPGLHNVRYVRSTSAATEFTLEGAQQATSWIPECTSQTERCVNFAESGVNTSAYTAANAYTVTYYDEDGVPLESQTHTLAAIPLTSEAAQAGGAPYFASITAFSPSNWALFSNGSNITVNWTAPSNPSSKVDDIILNTAQVKLERSIDHALSVRSGSALLGTWSGAAPSSAPSLNIWATSQTGHKFVTGTSYPGSPAP